MTDCRIRVDSIEVTERPVRMRMPFRYGVVTLREAPQSFVEVRISDAAGRAATGAAANLLAPKWFDKSPDLTNEENFDQLRRAVGLAKERYLETRDYLSPFALHALHDAALHEDAAAEGLNGLVAGFGNGCLDRAVFDAACRLAGVSFFDGVRANLMGLDAGTAPDLAGFDFQAFLAALRPAETIGCRHTVGLTDHIREADIDGDARIGDGLPESLEANIAAYGLTSFKVKVGGDATADLDRLSGIASVLDRAEAPYTATLDGNEQYDSVEAFADFYDRFAATRALDRFRAAIRTVEQPIARATALSTGLGALGETLDFEIDESDADISVFPAARALGYRGISSKSCKGLYRALLNRARVALWNAEEGEGRYFMSAEDLTTQPGLALQQDLSLAAVIGCTDVEKNGHQYGDGMAWARDAERRAFRDAHPDLYRIDGKRLNLRIENGRISLRSLIDEIPAGQSA